MKTDHLIVRRPGLNTTFQDFGRNHLYHIGLPFSGVMDKRNYLILNKLCGNDKASPVLEFAYQGPLLKFKGKKRNMVITGDVKFEIRKADESVIKGTCYRTFEIENNDMIDIISTNNSVFGYFSINGGFSLDKIWGSYSTTVRAAIGPNQGKKLIKDQIINLNKNSYISSKKINFLNSKIEFIRVIRGTNYDYFSNQSKLDFFSKEFVISKLSDRMGMRLEGVILDNKKSTNIKSEGLVKGTIQVPSDGNPIIMLCDHGTIVAIQNLAWLLQQILTN